MDENKTNINTEDTTEYTPSAEEENALKSFLERESSVDTNTEKCDKKRKLSKSALWIIIGAVAVLLIVGVVILLNLLPEPELETPQTTDAELTLTVDEKGEHQAALVLDEKGELEQNGYGTLIEYTPSDIRQIDVDNESGTFTIKADTPTETDEETGEETTGATVYTIVGYEDLTLQAGSADTIADDVASISFTSVADPTGEKADEFGFDNPRAVVKTTFNDDTTSTIFVGDDAPSELGTYVMFGDSKAVYVVATEEADGLLFSVLDLMTLNVNDSATDTNNAEFESVTLSGSAYGQDIEIRPNEDKAIDSSYVMISPEKMFVNEVEASNINGSIRGIYAQEAVCINPSSSKLSEYGLSTPYASLTAIYPDTTIHLRASKPHDGSVYLIADSNIIYKVDQTSVAWVDTTFEKLIPDVVIDPNFESLTKVVVKDDSGSYTFDVITTTETVETTEGTTEEVSVTTAKYKDKKLDSDNFSVFYQNICNIQNAGSTDSTPSGTPALTIELSYSTGRATDVIDIYATSNSKYVAALNNQVQCLVYKSYCTKFSDSVQNLIAGKTVSSF